MRLLQQHPKISSRASTFTVKNLDSTINYLEANGVKIYGMALTGPSKEILKLKQEDWIIGMKVGEVALWNME